MSPSRRPDLGPGRRPQAWLLCSLLLLAAGNVAALETRGHLKGQASFTDLPGDSLLREVGDDPQRDGGLDLRLKLEDRRGAWRWHADYQLLARAGDQLELQQRNPDLNFGTLPLPVDDRRVFDLERRIHDEDDRVVAHRLDRLYVGYSGDRTVVNLGRQAVSWGNGLIYNPVDFFNPFDPAAIDTEYKTGDDMIYAQYLFDSGSDLQAVWVGRRDASDDIDAAVASSALKYHGFGSSGEFDLLLAEHFDDRVLSLGGAFDYAEAVWRADLMLTDTGSERFESLVVNASYSWLAWEHNVSASVELFRNGFGIDDGDYSPAALNANPELLARILRGELFTLGRYYLAATATAELTPLWLLTTTLFANLDDDSTLLQLTSQHDLEQDLQLLLALNLPQGDDGSEFGGLDSAVPERTLAVGASAFAQLAWYF